MPSVLLWAYSVERNFLFAVSKRLRAFRNCLFTGKATAANSRRKLPIAFATPVVKMGFRKVRRLS